MALQSGRFASTSSRVGIDEEAPGRVTAIEAAIEASLSDSSGFFPAAILAIKNL